MALTPEDVVNKRFQPTKFREGYDQDEVDDFLDEVVVELRRLNQENEELRQRLISSDSRINELQRSAGQNSSAQNSSAQNSSAQSAPAQAAPAAAAPSFISQPAEPAHVEPAPAPAEQFAQPPVQSFVPQAPVPAVAPFAAAATDASVDPNNTNNLLQLARRLHEEHVREGVEKRDALIAEGHEEATRLVQEAEVAQRAAAQEAEAAQRAQLSTIEQERQQLEQERQQLEGKVEELRNFEREYRLKLKGYIEGQLRELDATNSIGSNGSGSNAAEATPAYAAPAAQQAAPNYTGFAGTN